MNTLIPFHTTQWGSVGISEHTGIEGVARWRSIELGDIRVRLVEYSADYSADHWCTKGHILYCVRGEITTRLETGEVFTLNEGMSYQVSNNLSKHRTESKSGALLFVVDGDFLNVQQKPIERNPWKM
jgi:quercetin dioxygenase-like cupin family protein